eukprot:14521869-Heterocapsa_arctica.AAC.1
MASALPHSKAEEMRRPELTSLPPAPTAPDERCAPKSGAESAWQLRGPGPTRGVPSSQSWVLSASVGFGLTISELIAAGRRPSERT